MILLSAITIIVELGLAILVGYLLLLTVCAFLAPRRTPAAVVNAPRHRFRILVPAHNEEKLLPALLANLGSLDYARHLYEVHVVADNCSDQTAALGRQGGAVVHERTNLEQRGKGYALNWLIEQLNAGDAVDGDGECAVVVLDADSVISPNFLAVMDERLGRGQRAIQAYYAVRDPGRSWSVSLRYAALAVLHYLRPQGRMVLGGSTGLKGNGMVFAAGILQRYPWSASLTEDIEYHMTLILNGIRVTFAPDAVVWAEMPGTLRGAQTQNVRWERGRMEMLRRYVPLLLDQALRRRSFMLFDAAMEQMIPPFSVLAGASVAALVAALILGHAGATILAIALIVGQIVYTLAGLWLAGAPAAVYRALLYAPALILWKILLYVRVVIGLDKQGWVRTKRD
jgi:1,2-diacylglycerol 3-beta-glucosyltransferase